MRVSSSVPVGCGHNLLSSSNLPKRAHRGSFRMASITQVDWDPDILRQTGRQLLDQFPDGSRKPAMVVKRSLLNELGAQLTTRPNLPIDRLEPEKYESGLTDHASLSIVYILTAIHAADPNCLTIRDKRVVCRVAETGDDTITIQLLRPITPKTAQPDIGHVQLHRPSTRTDRLVPA